MLAVTPCKAVIVQAGAHSVLLLAVCWFVAAVGMHKDARALPLAVLCWVCMNQKKPGLLWARGLLWTGHDQLCVCVC